MATLQKDLSVTQKHAFAKGTFSNLKCQWRKFFTFTQMLGRAEMPVSESVLCLYIQFLSRSLKSPVSIRNYVSGLKCLHEMLGFSFPSYDCMSVKLTFRGLDRLIQHVPQQAEPITVSLLLRIHKLLDLSSPVHSVVWCLFLFSFLLFSRKLQFIPVSHSAAQLQLLVARQDVFVSSNVLLVTFRWTKTRQFGGQPLVIPMSPIPGSPLCPLVAFQHMVRLVPASPESPAFVIPTFKGLQPILYSAFHQVLRSCISALGLQASRYSSHSFRRGGATFAFDCGLPADMIKSQGDWKSDCYKLYIDISAKHRLVVAKTLARCMAYQV